MRSFELPNIGDSRKSFYGKAVQLEDNNGTHLLSYGKNICTITPKNEVQIHTEVPNWDSNTSIRHLKSFLLFNDKPSGSKADIIKMYLDN